MKLLLVCKIFHRISNVQRQTFLFSPTFFNLLFECCTDFFTFNILASGICFKSLYSRIISEDIFYLVLVTEGRFTKFIKTE